jgi:hypothetical protein
MKFAILFLLIFSSCASHQSKPKFKHDADLVCKLASLEYKGPNQKKNNKKLPPVDPKEVRAAIYTMLPTLKECARQESIRTEKVDEIALCYVVGTNSKGKIIYSKFYSHDDKGFSKDFFKCLEDKKKRPDLSAFKSVKVTQPINLTMFK